VEKKKGGGGDSDLVRQVVAYGRSSLVRRSQHSILGLNLCQVFGSGSCWARLLPSSVCVVSVVNVPPLVHGLDTVGVFVLRFHRLAFTEKLLCAVTIEHTRLSLALSTISVSLRVTKREI
jgi:hypothetical protein